MPLLKFQPSYDLSSAGIIPSGNIKT